MKHAGPLLVLAAATYTGCAMIAIAIYTQAENPKPTTFWETFVHRLGSFPLALGGALWVVALVVLFFRSRDPQ